MLSVHNVGRLWRRDIAVLWLLQPRDARDLLIGQPHVRFVVSRNFRPVGFLTMRFLLKLLHILMALNNKKVLYRFLQ
jgi:hypothetical protein